MLLENCPVPADSRVWAEALALRDAGFQVSIIGPKGSNYDSESYACLEGIHVYRYNLASTTNRLSDYALEYGVSMFMIFFLSLRVWLRHGFDVIHAANPPDMFFLIALFYRPLGKKFVFDQHDLAPEMFRVKFQGRMRPLHRLLLLLERCSYRAAAVVITTNESQKRFAISRGLCDPAKVFVVRNGPDLQRIKRVRAEPELKRGSEHLLAYVGEMEVQDGIDFALYALHELVHRRSRADVTLALMGDGGHASTLRELAHTLQLDEYVYFTGWTNVETIVRYLSVADIGLTPDPSNGLNEFSTMVKNMEYMAVGLPIVAFDLPETRFTVRDAALYATDNSAEDFANKIEVLLDNTEVRLAMGENGRRRIAETLNWEHDKQNLLQAYALLFPPATQQAHPASSDPVELSSSQL